MKCVCVSVSVRACVRACVRVSVCVSVCVCNWKVSRWSFISLIVCFCVNCLLVAWKGLPWTPPCHRLRSEVLSFNLRTHSNFNCFSISCLFSLAALTVDGLVAACIKQQEKTKNNNNNNKKRSQSRVDFFSYINFVYLFLSFHALPEINRKKSFSWSRLPLHV